MLTFEEAYRNGHPNAANSLAGLYSARGNFSRAIQLWEEGCRQGCAHSAQNLGNCHMERGNFDQATACFKTLQLQGNINGTFGLADTHAAQGNYGMARQLFEECLKRGHPQASRALAQLDLLASDRAVPHEKSYAAGDQVWIKGLQSDAGQALNGCRGIVEKYHVDAHRFAVQIEGKGTKLFKPVNLQGCQGDAPESVRGPQVGDAVKIHGLKTTCKGQALNGCEGVVVGCDMSGGRRRVQLPSGKTHLFKPENLEVNLRPLTDTSIEDCGVQAALENSISQGEQTEKADGEAPQNVNAQISNALLLGADVDAGPRVVILRFSRCPKSLGEALLHAPELVGCAEALKVRGFSVELEKGAKVFVHPELYEATLEAVRLGAWTLCPNHVITEVRLEEVVLRVVNRLPSRDSVHPKGSQTVPLGFASFAVEHDSEISVTRSFIEVRIPSSLRSASRTGPRTVSTTDMFARKGGNPRGKR